MRLIDTARLRLREFPDNAIPRYAILSHTWGALEFSYADFLACQDKRLFAEGSKIVRSCQLALSEGWKYIWIDTCCIDKSSSAELTESINSMYKWYKNAGICYVYLADVSLLNDFSRKFADSRWFTRGWTLQELLAPLTISFQDKDWTEIGSKLSLEDAITRATNIPSKQLHDPMSASVAAKMSWASQRCTTRIEDMAYCLLGLFDVNMPLIYGEGTKAFARLQETIIRSSYDESIFAWKDKDVKNNGILATSPACFSESGDIVSTWLPHRRRPYSITNMGLEIELNARTEHNGLEEISGKRWTAPLACARKAALDRNVMIDLLEDHDGNGVRRGRRDVMKFSEQAVGNALKDFHPMLFHVAIGTPINFDYYSEGRPTNVCFIFSDKARKIFTNISAGVFRHLQAVQLGKNGIYDMDSNHIRILKLGVNFPNWAIHFSSTNRLRFALSPTFGKVASMIKVVRLPNRPGLTLKGYRLAPKVEIGLGWKQMNMQNFRESHIEAIGADQSLSFRLRHQYQGAKKIVAVHIDVMYYDRTKSLKRILS